MRWEVDGKLRDVQGCVERARDILERNKCECRLTETSASAVYEFIHTEFGDAGRIMLSPLPNDRTEVYGDEPNPPTDRWLVQYLPRNISSDLLGERVQALLAGYSRQIEQGTFDPSAGQLYHWHFTGEQVELGFEREGLDDLEALREAREGLDAWRKKLHDRRRQEFESVVGVIESMVRSAPLAFSKWEDANRVDVPARADESEQVPETGLSQSPDGSIISDAPLNTASTGSDASDELEAHSAAPQSQAAKPKMQHETELSLQQLREIRAEAILNNRPIPTRAAAMSLANITDKTWKIYDLDLWTKWYERGYDPEKQ